MQKADGNHDRLTLVSVLGRHYTSPEFVVMSHDFHRQRSKNHPGNNRAAYTELPLAGRKVK